MRCYPAHVGSQVSCRPCMQRQFPEFEFQLITILDPPTIEHELCLDTPQTSWSWDSSPLPPTYTFAPGQFTDCAIFTASPSPYCGDRPLLPESSKTIKRSDMSDFSVHDTVIWEDVFGNQVGSNVAAESFSYYLGTDLDKSQPNSFEVESHLIPSVKVMEEHQLITQVPLPTQNRTSNIVSCVDSKQGDVDMLPAKAVEPSIISKTAFA